MSSPVEVRGFYSTPVESLELTFCPFSHHTAFALLLAQADCYYALLSQFDHIAVPYEFVDKAHEIGRTPG